MFFCSGVLFVGTGVLFDETIIAGGGMGHDSWYDASNCDKISATQPKDTPLKTL